MKRIVIGLLIVVIVVGCGGNKDDGWSPFLSSDGTGVRGLDTPEQILTNPFVEEAFVKAKDRGVDLIPDKGLTPPVISGNYDLSGQACCGFLGGWQPLAAGTWRWFNQTSENHIDTEYDQIGMQVGSGGGEIIRGSGSSFTVYSVLEVDDTDQGGCKERVIAIVDGQQDSRGNISAVYILTPAQTRVCHSTTVGRLELTLSGSAVSTPVDGSTLITIIKNALDDEISQMNDY